MLFCNRGATKRPSIDLEGTLEKGLEKLSNLVEASLDNQTELQRTSKELEETAEDIRKSMQDVNNNLAVASDASNKLTNMVSMYREMLLAAPQIQQNKPRTGARQKEATDPRITRDVERRAKQVLVDVLNSKVTNRSLDEIRSKFNSLISGRTNRKSPRQTQACSKW